MRGIGDPDSVGTAFFVLLGVVVVVVTVLLVQAWFFDYEQQLASERLTGTPIEAAVRAEAAQRRQLEEYGWADTERTVVRIPIDRAMDLVVGEARGK